MLGLNCSTNGRECVLGKWLRKSKRERQLFTRNALRSKLSDNTNNSLKLVTRISSHFVESQINTQIQRTSYTHTCTHMHVRTHTDGRVSYCVSNYFFTALQPLKNPRAILLFIACETRGHRVCTEKEGYGQTLHNFHVDEKTIERRIDVKFANSEQQQTPERKEAKKITNFFFS